MKILIIATQLPPFLGSANIRLLNYINFLNRLGHTIDVVTVNYPKDSIAYDSSLENVFDKDIRIYRENPGLIFTLSYTRKSKERHSETEKNSVWKNRLKIHIKKIANSTVIIPDQFLMWINGAYKKAVNLMESNNYDCIFSLHETPSSHIVANKLKKKYKHIRWVGYWSDPWTDDSLRKDRSYFKKIIESHLEKSIVKNVDKLLFTTKDTEKLYIDKYNLINKSSIVLRGYNPEDYIEFLKPVNRPKELNEIKINVVHTGTIYGELRDIKPLVKALSKLNANEPFLYNKLQIFFIGNIDNHEDYVLLKSHKNITLMPLIPFAESTKYMLHADVLLLYGNRKSTQIPGKVYEYMGTNSIILSLLGDINDPMRNVEYLVDKGPIILNNAENIYSELMSLIINYQSFQERYSNPIDFYEWINVVRDLEKKILT